MQWILSSILAITGINSPVVEDGSTQADTTVVLSHHLAVIVLSTEYYCKRGAWPKDIGSVQAFRLESKNSAIYSPASEVVGSDPANYVTASDALTITTPAKTVGNSLKVTSINKVPSCTSSEAEFNAEIKFGGQPAT